MRLFKKKQGLSQSKQIELDTITQEQYQRLISEELSSDDETWSDGGSESHHVYNADSVLMEARKRGDKILEKLNFKKKTKLLSDDEVSLLLNDTKNLHLISVEYKGNTYYPAFQFNYQKNHVQLHDWVDDVQKILTETGMNGRDFSIWASIRNERFSRKKPVDCVDDKDFFQKTASSLAVI